MVMFHKDYKYVWKYCKDCHDKIYTPIILEECLGIDRESQVSVDKQVKTNNNTIPIYSDDQDDHYIQETFTNISGKRFYITKPTHHKCHLCGSQPMEGITLQDTSTGKYYCDDCAGKKQDYKEEKI